MFFARRYYVGLVMVAAGCSTLVGCTAGSLVNSGNSNGLSLPIPPGLEKINGRSTFAVASQPVLSKYLAGEPTTIDLTPMRVVHLAFENSPKIKSAYLRYVGEKARYDYIMATWTSNTPGAAIGPGWQRSLDADDTITNQRTQKAEAFLERNFLDTSQLRLFAGALNEDGDRADGYHPSAGGLFRFPLWISREALQRTSQQIFQQTRVNDAQLEYVKTVREQLSELTATFFAVLGIGQRVEFRQQQIRDLQAILARVEAGGGNPADRQRLEAEISTATSELRSQQSNYAIEMAWMTSTMGLPRDLTVRLVDEPFDPFNGAPAEELLGLSMRVDPEIATLQNAVKDAEVQLALARKGRLDVTAHLGAQADMKGSEAWTGRTEYRADALLSIAFIDPRVSNSLAREASANVAQYQQAITRRRNEVYVEAFEPLAKIQALEQMIPALRDNVERYRQDFQTAVEDYFAGRMDVDDLVSRRQDLLAQEFELSMRKSEMGSRMASLAGATSKFFELLAQPAPAASQPAGGAEATGSESPPTSRPMEETIP